MKAWPSLIVPFAAFAFLAFTDTLSAEENVRSLTPEALTQSCANVVAASREVKGVAENLTDFIQDRDSLKVKGEYEIKVFRLKPDLSSSLQIVVILEKGAESDAEIPRITAICMHQSIGLSKALEAGDISFHSTFGDKISIRFHLNKTSNDTGFLKYTRWKASGNDSIWMAGPFAEGAAHDPPGQKDWPTCLKPKNVTGSAANPDLSFDFDLCANKGHDAPEYEYALHLDQISNGATVDIGIDPLIINRP